MTYVTTLQNETGNTLTCVMSRRDVLIGVSQFIKVVKYHLSGLKNKDGKSIPAAITNSSTSNGLFQ